MIYKTDIGGELNGKAGCKIGHEYRQAQQSLFISESLKN